MIIAIIVFSVIAASFTAFKRGRLLLPWKPDPSNTFAALKKGFEGGAKIYIEPPPPKGKGGILRIWFLAGIKITFEDMKLALIKVGLSGDEMDLLALPGEESFDSRKKFFLKF